MEKIRVGNRGLTRGLIEVDKKLVMSYSHGG